MRVLHSVKRPDKRTNPFARLLVEALPHDLESYWFSWKRAFLSPYDVLHFQWPENLLSSARPARATAKTFALVALLFTLRIRRVPIVVTQHNLMPHEAVSGWKGRALRVLYRQAATVVLLNGSVEVPLERIGQKQAVILHGDYSDCYPVATDADVRPNLFLYFGALRAYKGVPGLVRAFQDAREQDHSAALKIIGRPWDATTAADIEAALAEASGVTAVLDDLDESLLVQEIRSAGLVVLPYTRLYNSGAALLSLTLKTPILAPRTATTCELQEEFGPTWVHLYDAPLKGEHLLGAIAAAQKLDRTVGPDLSRRDWRELGRQYAAVYRQAVESRSVKL